MAENKPPDQEMEETPEIPVPGPTPDEPTPAIEPGLAEPLDETEIMETHAPHVHHAPEKKTWHYFYEFLMLFLAVFCGLLAENWREHYVEQQREKKFARQLVADLRADSIQFARLHEDMSRVVSKQDAFIDLMSSPEISTDIEIISGISQLQWVYRVNKTSTTYDQMKASGSLRYIRNTDLTSSLQRYYEIMLPFFEAMADQSMRVYTSHLEPFSLEHFRRGDIDINSDTLVNKNPIYRNRTAESDFRLRNIMVLYREYISISLERFLNDDIKKVNELIVSLEKEYSLK